LIILTFIFYLILHENLFDDNIVFIMCFWGTLSKNRFQNVNIKYCEVG